jgi:hypothetical protein
MGLRFDKAKLFAGSELTAEETFYETTELFVGIAIGVGRLRI